MNFIQERAAIPFSVVPTFLSLRLPVFIVSIICVNWACWFCMPLCCVPEDGDLSLKHVGNFHVCGLLTVLYELCALVGECG